MRTPLRRRLARAWRLAEIHLGRRRLSSGPATINIELTGRCNVKPPCTFCVGKNLPDYQEPGHLDWERYWPQLLKAERVNDCSFGEPLLHPAFEATVERLAAAGVKFGFTSNGLLLDERRARFLAERGPCLDMCVSLNAASRETYFQHHGRSFDKVVSNLERFVALHESLHPGAPMPLVVSFIVMRSNRHEVVPFLRLAGRLGARAALLRHLFDVAAGDFAVNNFGLDFVYERERLRFEEYQEIEAGIRRGPEFSPSDQTWGGARGARPPLELYFAWNSKDAFIAEQAEPGIDIPCLFPWKFLCVRPLHGSFNPCVYLKAKSVAPSPDASFEEVWNGEVMRGLRRSLAKGEIPAFCMANGHTCPLVLERRSDARLLQVEVRR